VKPRAGLIAVVNRKVLGPAGDQTPAVQPLRIILYLLHSRPLFTKQVPGLSVLSDHCSKLILEPGIWHIYLLVSVCKPPTNLYMQSINAFTSLMKLQLTDNSTQCVKLMQYWDFVSVFPSACMYNF
jgi:hypothetical protein